MSNEQKDFFSELAGQLKIRDNPKDLKSAIIAIVEQIEPYIIVSYSDGSIQLHENDELIISEWFRFRCNIDKTKALSETVTSNCDNSKQSCSDAKNVEETHSANAKPCNMPNAISNLVNSAKFLSDAILQINAELLALKCELKIGDNVVIASLENKDRFILLDKVLDKEL